MSDEPSRPWEMVVTKAAEQDIKQIGKGSAKDKLFSQIRDKLIRAPLDFGEPLRKPLDRCRRIRLGKFRAVYLPRPETRKVFLLSVKHRGSVYDDQDLQDLLDGLLDEHPEDDN